MTSRSFGLGTPKYLSLSNEFPNISFRFSLLLSFKITYGSVVPKNYSKIVSGSPEK